MWIWEGRTTHGVFASNQEGAVGENPFNTDGETGRNCSLNNAIKKMGDGGRLDKCTDGIQTFSAGMHKERIPGIYSPLIRHLIPDNYLIRLLTLWGTDSIMSGRFSTTAYVMSVNPH